MTGESVGAQLWRTFVAWLACLLGTLVLIAPLDGREWFVRALGVLTLVAVLGGLGRAARVPRPLIVAVQVLGGWCYLTALYASDYARGGFLPDRDSLEVLQNLADEGFFQIETLTPPVVPGDGMSLVIVAAVLLVAVQIDLLAVSYRMTAVAGLPLLALYVVPSTLMPDGVDAWLFTLPAFGFLLLLVTDSRDRLLGWGIPIGGRLTEGGAGRGAGQLTRMSRNVGVTVLSLSVVVPAAIPRITDGAFGDAGIGDTKGRTISTLDPLVTMRRNLLNRTDVDLMRVRTDSARPNELYLRAVTLDEFNGVEWKAARREVRKFDGRLPDAPGLTPTVETSPVQTEVSTGGNMQSDYLPMPYPAYQLAIEGAWRLDELTGNVVSYEGREQISGKQYSVSSFDMSPVKEDVRDEEPTSSYLQPYLQLPEIPEAVLDTARRVTREAEGPLEIGIALQQWFRRPGNFVYDLRTPSGTGNSALLDFLRDRRGYCEHFSTAMAVMARSLGVPSRINVGFTAGELADDGISRVISSDDAHAWPELWLPGVGWTRFEPTPGSANSNPSAPSWLNEGSQPEPDDTAGEDNDADTRPEDSEGSDPSEGSTGAGAQPGTGTLDCSLNPNAPGCEGNPPPEEPDPLLTSESHWVRDLLAMIFILFLVFLPYNARVLLRRRRWAIAAREGGVIAAEMAWRELRDDARDLGYFWSAARTPRQTVAELRADGQMSAAGAAELGLIAATLERSRYAKDDGGVPAARLRTAGIAVRRDLGVKVGRVNRFRATWMPRSPRERLTDVIKGGMFAPGVGRRALARTKQVVRTRSFRTS